MKTQYSRTLENKRISQRFPSDHRKKNLIEDFVDPAFSALGIHGDPRLRSADFPGFVQLGEFKSRQQRSSGGVFCNQSSPDSIQPGTERSSFKVDTYQVEDRTHTPLKVAT